MFTTELNDQHENFYNTEIKYGGTALLKIDNALFYEI